MTALSRSSCQFCNARIMEARPHRDWCPVIGGGGLGKEDEEMINRPGKRVTVRDASGGQPPLMPRVVHRNIQSGHGKLVVGLKTFDADGDHPEVTTLRIRVEHQCSMASNAAAIDLSVEQIAELLEAIDEFQGRVTLRETEGETDG